MGSGKGKSRRLSAQAAAAATSPRSEYSFENIVPKTEETKMTPSRQELLQAAAYEARVLEAHYEGYSRIPVAATRRASQRVELLRRMVLLNSDLEPLRRNLGETAVMLSDLCTKYKTFPPNSRKKIIIEQIRNLRTLSGGGWPHDNYSRHSRGLTLELKALLKGARMENMPLQKVGADELGKVAF